MKEICPGSCFPRNYLKSDFINNKDHMRISGTEPSSEILIAELSSLKS